MKLFSILLTLIWALAWPGGAAAAESKTRSEWQREFRRPAAVPYPASNPFSPAKASLGKALFFDPILSGSGTRSCASCHSPGLSWGDSLPRAMGEGQKEMALRSPTLLNIAFLDVLGLDGKFADLEAVAFAPITGGANMNQSETALIEALQANPGYPAMFAAAFPGQAITRRTIELALATFERGIVSGPAPFDRWVEGDGGAIPAEAQRGFDLFVGKAGCVGCHGGWTFTDGSFHDIGSASGGDIGRAKYFAASLKLTHAFKVPTLRDAARRAPYMHDGSLADLAAVLELYDRGGVARPSRSELIKPLGLSAGEKAALIAFIRTLTGEEPPFVFPILPR